MNENEVSRIASAVNQLRPDWPTSSIATLVTSKLGSRTRRDVAVALTWVACDSASKTPARVLEAGPWWQAVNAEGSNVIRFPPKRGEDCRKHPGEWPETCRGCASDRLAGDDSTFNPRRQDAPGDALALARANLTQAKAQLCSHGVPPRHCKERHDDEETA